MGFTVGELSKLTGVTVRALHHYDEIGLVRPSERSAAGYRLYVKRDVERLQQVLLFRELGLPLDDIAVVLQSGESHEALLRRHREVLVTRRTKLDAMIRAVDARLSGNSTEQEHVMNHGTLSSMFEGFDPARYEDEAEARWGDTSAHAESARRTRSYSHEDWDRYRSEADAVHEALARKMNEGASPDDPAVRAEVENHRRLIDRWFYPCSVEMHRKLGEMYAADARFAASFDAVAPGLAAFLSDAIARSTACDGP